MHAIARFTNKPSDWLKCNNTDNTPTLNKDLLPDIPSIQVHPQGIQHLLSNLNDNKSGGPWQSTSSFLKEIVAEVAPALSIVFQASLNQGVLPDI